MWSLLTVCFCYRVKLKTITQHLVKIVKMVKFGQK